MKNIYYTIGIVYAMYYLFHVIKDLFFTSNDTKKNEQEQLFNFEPEDEEDYKPKKVYAEDLEQQFEKENNSFNATNDDLQELIEQAETEGDWKAQEAEELRQIAEEERSNKLKALDEIENETQLTNNNINKDANDLIVNEESFDMSRKKSITEHLTDFDNILTEEEEESLSKFTSILK
jgi:glycogen debranching enzyme